MMARRELSTTIPRLFWDRCRRTPDTVALRAKKHGIYQEVAWAQYGERVERLGLGLVELGVEPGDRVAIMADPCPEWCYADLAAQSVGAITYGIYSTSSPSQVKYLLENGGARVVVAENQEYVDKILPLADGLPSLRKIIVVDTRAMFLYDDRRLMNLSEVEELGRKLRTREPGLFEKLIARAASDDVAFFVYTSGTSGPPKPAMLSHRNLLTASVDAFREVFPDLEREEHRSVSYLSMAHILERILTIYLPLAYRLVPHFGESVEDLPETLFETQPTFVCGVPRIWEKIASQVLVSVQSTSWFRSQAYRWAMAIGTRARERQWQDARVPLALGTLNWIARQLVFRHILRKVGLLRVRYAVSAGAPLPPRIQAIWQIWGIDLVNLYGATEAGGIITTQRPGFRRPGDVGTPTSANAVRLEPDGEVLVSGSGIFVGYWRNEEATCEAKSDGALRVGEVGEWTPDGALRLIDRKRDIMVTAGGKNLAPTNIENCLKSSPYISEAVVFADGRKFPAALIEIDAGTVSEWARAHRVIYSDFASLVSHPSVQDLIAEEVRRSNEQLAQVERVKQFRLLPKELDPENEDDPLTPTRKVQRRRMYEKFRDLVESMYAGEEAELLDTELARLERI
jgi:long-chain acyl-CoA synthetase